MERKIGLITIGQSPRLDMTPEMRPLLDPSTEFVEVGALDDLSREDIEKLAPAKGEVTYISRLRNGESVKLSKEKLLPHLQQKIHEIEQNVSSSIVVCTGSFPTIMHNKPLLFPDQILKGVVEAVIGKGTMGLIVPLEEQKNQLLEKWGDIPVVVAASSPYEELNIEDTAKELKAKGVDLLVLDCMGYTEQHKRRVKSATDLPVILSRSIVARVAAEMT